MFTETELDPPQWDALTTAIVGGPCHRISTPLVPWPLMMEPLFGGVTVHCTGKGPVAVKLVVASTQTFSGPAGVMTGGPYLNTGSVCGKEVQKTPGLISTC